MTSPPAGKMSDRKRLGERRWREEEKRFFMKALVCLFACVCHIQWVIFSQTSPTQICLSSPPPTTPRINNWLSLLRRWSTGVRHFALRTSFLEMRQRDSFFFCLARFLSLSFAYIFPSQNSLQETMNSERFFFKGVNRLSIIEQQSAAAISIY